LLVADLIFWLIEIMSFDPRNTKPKVKVATRSESAVISPVLVLVLLGLVLLINGAISGI
jgi:hypothetical protein